MTALRAAERHPRDAVVLGLAAALIAVAFSWVPSIWYDEAATVTAATRPLDRLAVMVGEIDLVHGLYYLLMHGWFELVGYTPFTLRLPSALAAGAAVALTVLLVQRVGTRRIALLSGAVLAVLPRFTWAGAEGRSFALGTALGVGATLLLVVVLDTQLAARSDTAVTRRRRLLLWAAYAALAVVSVWIFLYLALVFAAHAIALIVLSGHRLRETAPPFLASGAAVLLATWPLVAGAREQAAQVSWIHPLSRRTVSDILVVQYFPFAEWAALLAWPLALGGIAIMMLRRRRQVALLGLVLPLLVVPLAGILLASELISPLYSPRYLTFTIPAFAICVGVLLDALRPWAVRIAVGALLLALVAPVYVAQHQPTAKQRSTWSQAAALVESGSARIDGKQGLLWGPTRRHPSANSRIIALSYPESFAGLVDLSGGDEPTGLWPRDLPVDPDSLDGLQAVWMLTSDLARDVGKRALLLEGGFVETREWELDYVDVVLFERR